MNTWVCIAGGPSLREKDIHLCRRKGWNLATCNLTFRLVPDALVYLATDTRFWREYGEEVQRTMRPECELWTGDHWASVHFQIRRFKSQNQGAWPDQPGNACWGALSGFKLVGLVGERDPRPARIILLGYDHMHTGGKFHHHEDYPKGWTNAASLENHTHRYEAMAKESPVEILNASRETALGCFERVKLEDL